MKGTKPIMYIRSEICLTIYDFLIICFVVGGGLLKLWGACLFIIVNFDWIALSVIFLKFKL